MSGKEPGNFTRQVFGESLESLQDENIAESMPVRDAKSEILHKSPSNEDEDNAGALKATVFAPHPPEKPKDSNQSPGRNKKKKRFLRPSNRVGLQSQSSDDEQHIHRERLLDNRTTGAKLPPLSKDLNNDFKIKANDDTFDHSTSLNGVVDKNLQQPLKLKLKPLSPIGDSLKVAHDFKEKQSLERGKHEPKDKGPLKPPNPIDRVPEPDHLDEQTSSNNAAFLYSNKPSTADDINHDDSNVVDDKSEDTLTSVSSNDSGSDSDSDSQLSPLNDTNVPGSQLAPTAPSNTPPTHHRHHHRSTLSLNSVHDHPEQVDRHSDTEAVRRRRNGKHRNSKELWGRAKYITYLPRVPASKARDRNSNFIQEELEKYLPERKLMVFVGTWNMHGEKVKMMKIHNYHFFVLMFLHQIL
jgi:hypothetical protein